MGNEFLVFAPVFLPLLGAALAFCAKAFLPAGMRQTAEYAAAFIGLALPWAGLAAILPQLLEGADLSGVIGHWRGGIGIRYRYDGLAWLVNFLGYTVGGAAWIYSRGAGPRSPLFTPVFLIQTAALGATAVTTDLFNLFVCLEVMGIASYILVAESRKPGAYLAAFSYLMVSAAAMIFYLLGLYGFYRLTGSLDYSAVAEGLRALPGSGGYTAQLSLALITAAVAMRVAVMPLYGWLPDAHATAPHAVSAVLSGVLIKTPLFALSRILFLLPAGHAAGELLGYAGAVTALLAVLLALSQQDAKRLLAYHSISQIGYVVCAWGAAVHLGAESPQGRLLMTAAYLHALFHALFKGLLFLSVGRTIDKTGERNVYRLRGAAGSLRRGGEVFPLTLLCFLTGALAITAIPPLNGFASKNILGQLMKGTWQGWLLTAAGAGTVASFLKLGRIYLPSRRGRPAATSPASTSAVSGVPVPGAPAPQAAVLLAEAFLALLCLAAGLLIEPVRETAFRLLAGSSFSTPPEPVPLYTAKVLTKTGLTVAGGGLLFFLALSAPGTALLKGIRNRPRSYQGLFTAFILGCAALAAWMGLAG